MPSLKFYGRSIFLCFVTHEKSPWMCCCFLFGIAVWGWHGQLRPLKLITRHLFCCTTIQPFLVSFIVFACSMLPLFCLAKPCGDEASVEFNIPSDLVKKTLLGESLKHIQFGVKSVGNQSVFWWAFYWIFFFSFAPNSFTWHTSRRNGWMLFRISFFLRPFRCQFLPQIKNLLLRWCFITRYWFNPAVLNQTLSVYTGT